MTYHHTQTGGIHYILWFVAAVLLVSAWLFPANAGQVYPLTGAALVMGVLGMAFGSLTVQDQGDALDVCFGPLPLFRKRIPYRDITAVEPDRTHFIDGWGIHWIPGRGWAYNVWGYGCVKITLAKRVIRVGSDDVDNLVRFLTDRVQQPY